MTMILMGTGPAHRHLAPHQEDPSQEREEEREREREQEQEQEQEPVADLEVEAVADLEAEAEAEVDRKAEVEADQPAEVEEQLQLFNSGRRPVVTRIGYREESQTGTGSRRSHYPQV
ncbi:hypothetical protein PS850_02453 [Pseudomonas fluorescens]|nr:hypothetical protein PS850_02453 [Pseudomonas fluorescens]